MYNIYNIIYIIYYIHIYIQYIYSMVIPSSLSLTTAFCIFSSSWHDTKRCFRSAKRWSSSASFWAVKSVRKMLFDVDDMMLDITYWCCLWCFFESGTYWLMHASKVGCVCFQCCFHNRLTHLTLVLHIKRGESSYN